ncbi:hypothetical protein KDA00_00475 [Candidatus Saccharibacteria bacterium]|nr:hypothetical protein [Candidatus Saccharibacteria bacterium]
MADERMLSGDEVLNRDLLLKFLEERAAESDVSQEPSRGHFFDVDPANSPDRLVLDSLIKAFMNGGYQTLLGNRQNVVQEQYVPVQAVDTTLEPAPLTSTPEPVATPQQGRQIRRDVGLH